MHLNPSVHILFVTFLSHINGDTICMGLMTYPGIEPIDVHFCCTWKCDICWEVNVLIEHTDTCSTMRIVLYVIRL